MKKTDRELCWATKDGELVPVNEMSDAHLMNSIDLSRRRIMAAKLATGKLSLSLLSLDYMISEARDRGLISDDEDSSDPND